VSRLAGLARNAEAAGITRMPHGGRLSDVAWRRSTRCPPRAATADDDQW
jgi:hypothetical protein